MCAEVSRQYKYEIAFDYVRKYSQSEFRSKQSLFQSSDHLVCASLSEFEDVCRNFQVFDASTVAGYFIEFRTQGFLFSIFVIVTIDVR